MTTRLEAMLARIKAHDEAKPGGAPQCIVGLLELCRFNRDGTFHMGVCGTLDRDQREALRDYLNFWLGPAEAPDARYVEKPGKGIDDARNWDARNWADPTPGPEAKLVPTPNPDARESRPKAQVIIRPAGVVKALRSATRTTGAKR